MNGRKKSNRNKSFDFISNQINLILKFDSTNIELLLLKTLDLIRSNFYERDLVKLKIQN